MADPIDEEAIRALAHRFWLERGCPVDSPEVDWFRAEKQVLALKQKPDTLLRFAAVYVGSLLGTIARDLVDIGNTQAE